VAEASVTKAEQVVASSSKHAPFMDVACNCQKRKNSDTLKAHANFKVHLSFLHTSKATIKAPPVLICQRGITLRLPASSTLAALHCLCVCASSFLRVLSVCCAGSLHGTLLRVQAPQHPPNAQQNADVAPETCPSGWAAAASSTMQASW
jgi:hypothetical protein